MKFIEARNYTSGRDSSIDLLIIHTMEAPEKGETAENFVLLNTQMLPLDDVDARRALAHATDKEQINDARSAGFDSRK